MHRWSRMLTAVGVAVLLYLPAAPDPAQGQEPACPPTPVKLSPGGPAGSCPD